jgi:hypothetical protein
VIELIKTKEYPFIVAGLGVRRWERYPDDAPTGEKEMLTDESGLMFMADKSAEKWGPSGVQKFSPIGFQLTARPCCFHIWIQFRKQTPGVPGSEITFYWRAGLGRWDPNMGGVIKNVFNIFGKRIIFGTWYGPGLHWD